MPCLLCGLRHRALLYLMQGHFHILPFSLRFIGVEQMHPPHQPPSTIEGAKTLLEATCQSAQAPFYLTLDLGHMNGSVSQVSEDASECAAPRPSPIWIAGSRIVSVLGNFP